ncbi:MAG: twin-arginine translocase subunit TatC [Actinobacteria bacterium]|nr:MAG: twin-arginine translocase subunit TatC [Actinomycetota bacterium]
MNDAKIDFWDHVSEARKRLLLSSIIVLVLGSVCYVYWEFLYSIIAKPAGVQKFISISVMEPFSARFKLALWGGFLLGFPFILYQLLAFIVPGLTKREKRFLIVMALFMVALFYGGIYFGYTYVLAIAIRWLEAQGAGLITPYLTISQYISFIGLFLLAFGISFETPVIIVVLVRVGVVRPITLIKQWRVVVIIILLAAAILTPDWSPVTMGIMALPMLVLYILGVGLSFIFAPKKRLRESRSEAG